MRQGTIENVNNGDPLSKSQMQMSRMRMSISKQWTLSENGTDNGDLETV